MAEPIRIPERQLDLGSASYFRVVTEAVPGNQVKVRPGFVYAGAHAILDGFSGGEQTTAGFAPVLAAQQRYDLVYLDIAGAATILQGNSVAFGSPVFDGAPGFNAGPVMPDQALPLAYVFVEETGAVVVDTADIIVLGGQFQVTRDLLGYLVDKGLFGGAPAGLSDDVSALFVGEVFGGGTVTAGVVTTAPLNYTRLLDQAGDEILHSTGARMYGRLTEAAAVVTLAYHYLDAAGAEQTMDPSTDADGVAPTDLRLVGVPKVFSQNDPNRPLFPADVSRLSDQVVGDIAVATQVVQGKARIASDGALTGVDVALGTTDPRLGGAGVSGRANAGAVLGPEPIVRLIQGAGITVSLSQAGGELRFTITALPAAGGVDNFAFGTFGAVALMSVATGWTPRIAFAGQNSGGLNENHSFGVCASTYVAATPPHNSMHLSVSVSIFGAGAGFGADMIPGWSCTVFSNVQVSVSGGGINSGHLLAFGGA